MSTKPLATRLDHTEDAALAVAQRETRKLAQRANGCPFLAGILRSVTLVAATAKTVDHGLGSRAAFIVVRPNYDGTGAASTVVEAATASQSAIDTNNQLSIIASANCTVDLWFYPIASEITPR